MNRMKELYVSEIAPALNKKFGYKSVMQIPKLSKVIVNVACGESKNNAKEIEAICKDFRGINPNSFDGRGNYAFGLKEQLIFPEIEYDKVDKIRGMDICICTTATTDEEAKALLDMLGAPFHA